jgi:hypothetical protein
LHLSAALTIPSLDEKSKMVVISGVTLPGVYLRELFIEVCRDLSRIQDIPGSHVF